MKQKPLFVSEFIPNNYDLLKEIHGYLKTFPFANEVKFQLEAINMDAIYDTYLPHSDIEEDIVANAICWSISNLKSLLNKNSVKCFDEVISFVESVLTKHGEVDFK